MYQFRKDRAKIKIGERYKVDTCGIPQYENTRLVDTVKILEVQDKYCLCYSPLLKANILVRKFDLRFRQKLIKKVFLTI